MNAQITITIKLFGALRQFSEDHAVIISVPVNSHLNTLKKALVNSLLGSPTSTSNTALFESSVFANDSEILTLETILSKNQTLTLLPPVCGG